jgi:hypothetical protein
MSKIYLSWREALEGDLPMVCATCGDNATEWVERRLSTVRPGFFCIVRTRTTVTLPFCRRHRVASWNGFARVTARSISTEGVTLGQVAEDFVDAVWDYRDHPERYRRRTRRRAGDRGEEDEWEEAEPRPRRRRSGDGGRVLYAVLMPVLVAVIVAGCGFGLLFFNLLRSRPAAGPAHPGLNRPGPADPPGRPPFRR